MMRLVLFGAIAFVLGMAGGTGFVAMRPPAKGAAGADSLQAANADSADVARDSIAAHAAKPEAKPAAAPVELAGVAPAALAMTHAAVAAPAGPATSSRQAAPDPAILDGGALADSCRAVSKILSTMKPADAAKIMNHLSDDQVEGILRASGVRQAGVLMAQLPPERAATMSRRFITRPQGAVR